MSQFLFKIYKKIYILYAHKIGAEVGMQGRGWRVLKPKD